MWNPFKKSKEQQTEDEIELYKIKFRVHHSHKEINNGNEICVTVHGVNKNIYKIL